MQTNSVVEIERRIRLSLAGRGRDAAHSLPWLATDALVAGFDSPSLRDLAGRSTDDYSEDLVALLRDSADELGIDRPDERSAYLLDIYDLCLRMDRGRITPSRAAHEIYWNNIWTDVDIVVEIEGEAVAFSILTDEDDPGAPEREAAFVRAAREFVDGYEAGSQLVLSPRHINSLQEVPPSKEEPRSSRGAALMVMIVIVVLVVLFLAWQLR